MSTIFVKILKPTAFTHCLKVNANFLNNFRHCHSSNRGTINLNKSPAVSGFLRSKNCVTDRNYNNAMLCNLSVSFISKMGISSSSVQGIQENISPLQIKKRALRKKRTLDDDESRHPGQYNVLAFATAEEYDLEQLIEGLKNEDLYEPKKIENNLDVVHAVAKYEVCKEPREIFFFREGTVILWNITDLESSNILNFLRAYEQDSYSDPIVQSEGEVMTYKHQATGKNSLLEPNGDLLLATEENVTLEKYTFSNAMSLSVKLGVWESSLEKYVDSIEFVTEDLKKGNKIKMTREEVLRKHGELFALRHLINLSSDLLDTPDFYWDREQLEVLYSQTCSYFTIARRTRVMNEKLNHCVELIELLSTHLSDKHHVRLEWMIIILIMVEVGFECIHYADRFMG